MGVINVTPDSFSDGGLYLDPGAAIEHGLALEAQGAAMLDIGGESTRPGAEPVPAEVELERVLPVIEGLLERGAASQLSIDTSKASVAAQAVRAGATFVNDVTALRGDPDMAALIADSGAECCLMHMLGEPRTMQLDPRYDDVVGEVKRFLEQRLAFAVRSGIAEERIMVDPGIGFGKTSAHNLELLRRLDEIVAIGRPVVVGTSRKSFLGRLTGRDADSPTAGHDRDERAGVTSAAPACSGSTTWPRWRRARGDGCYGGAAMEPDDDTDDYDELDADDEDDDEGHPEPEVTIEVSGLSLFTHVGVTAAEREVGQRLLLDLRLDVGECDATVTDRIEDTVDYARGLRHRQPRRPAAFLQNARAAVRGDRRPPARAIRSACRLGEGRQAGAAACAAA